MAPCSISYSGHRWPGRTLAQKLFQEISGLAHPNSCSFHLPCLCLGDDHLICSMCVRCMVSSLLQPQQQKLETDINKTLCLLVAAAHLMRLSDSHRSMTLPLKWENQNSEHPCQLICCTLESTHDLNFRLYVQNKVQLWQLIKNTSPTKIINRTTNDWKIMSFFAIFQC